jgi:hypothetical protein
LFFIIKYYTRYYTRSTPLLHPPHPVVNWKSKGGAAVKSEETIRKTLKLLECNHVNVKDIAEYTGTDEAGARRAVDTISLDYPLYEIRRGVYGILPADMGEQKPYGLIARANAAMGLPVP